MDERKAVTVFLGTRGECLYRATLDTETGKLGAAESATAINAPGFVAINRAGTRLYSLGQVEGHAGNIASYAVDSTGGPLRLLDTVDTGGGKPTHISLSNDEGTLLLAHYGGGSVATVPVDDRGKLGQPVLVEHRGSSVDPSRQDRPHPHWIGASPDGRFVMVPDLGTDQVVIYRLVAGGLAPHALGSVPPGAGPRHLKFHPSLPCAYVINEMGLSVTTFAYEAEAGTLRAVDTVRLLDVNQCKVECAGSEIRVHPTGKFVYAGVRGEDLIAVFAVDERGRLTLVERESVRGSWPRNFGIDPTGKWLLAAGAESATLAVFRIDAQSGRLYFTRQVVSVPQVICVEFLDPQPHN